MQLEVILPLVAYLVVVFGIGALAPSLMSISSAAALWAVLCWR